MSLDIKAALTGTLRRMHYVQRYSSIPVIKPENVAEHSWQVSMLSYLIALDLRERLPRISVSMEILLRRALVHDVSEAMSGDIIRSYKHSSIEMRRACEVADLQNMESLRGVLPSAIITDWELAKHGDLEGDIVSLADLLCVVSYCVSEHNLGNRQADFVMKDMYEGALNVWSEHPILGFYVTTLYPNRKWDDPYGA